MRKCRECKGLSIDTTYDSPLKIAAGDKQNHQNSLIHKMWKSEKKKISFLFGLFSFCSIHLFSSTSIPFTVFYFSPIILLLFSALPFPFPKVGTKSLFR